MRGNEATKKAGKHLHTRRLTCLVVAIIIATGFARVFENCGRFPSGAFSLLYDVGVLELLEERDLTDGGAGNSLVFRLQSNLLHRHELARLGVSSLVDDAVRPLAYLFYLLVVPHRHVDS